MADRITNSIVTQRRRLKTPSFARHFREQNLPAWQPVLTAGTVLPTFFVFGIAFIPIGFGILFFSSEIQEKVVEYTHCNSSDAGFNGTCAAIIGDFRNLTCNCAVSFSLDVDFRSQVFIYYGLTNYYQNHRRYVKSRDDRQLLGRLLPEVSKDCSPFMYSIDDNGTRKPIIPCGAIADSLFTDVLTISYKPNSHERAIEIPTIKKGIAWPSDKKFKFRNPPGDLKEAFKNFEKPIHWRKHIWELDPDDPSNNGLQNEDFIVWMRTAALPNFRKFYRIINHTETPFEFGLPKGNYILNVVYTYPVTAFKGSKSLIITTASALSGKNMYLGVLYIIIGFVLIIAGVVLLVIHTKYGKRAAELIHVTPLTLYI